MDIINSYEDTPPKKNLLYLAKPVYGGWVTFTSHLSHRHDAPIYKISKRNETFQRDFGYECKYRNMSIGEIIKLDNIVITAVDKHYWDYLHLFPADTEIIIHDPTECKKSKNTYFKMNNKIIDISIKRAQLKKLIQYIFLQR